MVNEFSANRSKYHTKPHRASAISVVVVIKTKSIRCLLIKYNVKGHVFHSPLFPFHLASITFNRHFAVRLNSTEGNLGTCYRGIYIQSTEKDEKTTPFGHLPHPHLLIIWLS